MVGADGVLPLPWLEPVLRRTLSSQNAHALLLHGPQGIGQFELSLTIAQAWLCEAENPGARPCGTCGSCHLVLAHSHPDLLVLIPDASREALGWGSAESEEAGAERASKAKPSKEIKVDAVRSAVGFAQSTSARGRGKVVVLHPAERMNGIAGNALLKTLEEPPGEARFLLSCAAPDALLPTIRSRCQSVALSLPPADLSTEWLKGQGVGDAAVLLAATGGQPQEALDWFRQGVDAATWAQVPAAVAQGSAAVFASWPLPRVVDALQRLCHDAACVAAGAGPRYFPAGSIRPGANSAALAEWGHELNRVARHAEHPWNAGLVSESLVQQGQRALATDAQKGPRKQAVSVHSRG
jgi:DNA polymerase-3 subunit delta'